MNLRDFYERLRQGEKIEWQPAYSTEHSRKKGQLIIYQTYAVERSREGYQIIWVHSSSKEKIDRSSREKRISKAEENLIKLSTELNKYYLKTKDQIEKAIVKACKGAKIFGILLYILEKFFDFNIAFNYTLFD